MPSSQNAPDAFPTIGGYGFLSDCHTSALVSFDGAVEWLCLPRFDSPSVFAALLDRGAGRLTLRPPGVVVPISRRYRPGTLVVETDDPNVGIKPDGSELVVTGAGVKELMSLVAMRLVLQWMSRRRRRASYTAGEALAATL